MEAYRKHFRNGRLELAEPGGLAGRDTVKVTPLGSANSASVGSRCRRWTSASSEN